MQSKQVGEQLQKPNWLGDVSDFSLILPAEAHSSKRFVLILAAGQVRCSNFGECDKQSARIHSRPLYFKAAVSHEPLT